jgi:hypothetical protein
MNNGILQKEFFHKLTEDRAESAKTLEKRSMRGVKHSVVEKYSDQAHFIYELLQNADDAQATQARFILTNEALTFIHNGDIGFSVSNPDTEDEDSENMKLGHINAITSIGNTTKDKAKIGKFGVGFKAIFQYTNTPHIYDPNFCFKIERFIVPQLLEQDKSERQENETLFYFPFDLQNNSRDAYNDIFQKLKSLIHPVLFLNNLKEVLWRTPKQIGKYTKTIIEEKKYNETLCQLINLIDGRESKTLWLFTNELEGTSHKYSVGFFLDKNGKIDTSNTYSAFCFFPTKEATTLKFIIHAPFLLTDSREGIKAGDSWNNKLVMKLSELAAESLCLLKEIGIEKEQYLIDDNVINLIPFKKNDFVDLNDRNKISFLPFYSAIKAKLQNETILPAKNNNYSTKNLSFWASDTELTELFSDEQISELMGVVNAKWVFPTLGRKTAQNEKEIINYYNSISYKTDYIDSLVLNFLDPDKLLRRIDEEFILKQSFQWLNNFYKYLLDKRSYWDIIKKKTIFINSENKTVSAFDSETGKNLILFFPTEIDTSYQTIHKDFLKNEDSMLFFEAFGITTPSLKDEIYNHIIPLYTSNESLDTKPHFELFFKYYQICPSNELNEFINLIHDKSFLRFRSKSTDIIYRGKASSIYYPTNDLLIYFDKKTDTYFLDIEFYNELIPDKIVEFEKFIDDLGIMKLPALYYRDVKFSSLTRQTRKINSGTYDIYLHDKYFDGSEELMSSISIEKSILFWKILCEEIRKYGTSSFVELIQGSHKYFYRTDRIEKFDSSEFIRLTTEKWLYTKQNIFVSAKNLSVDDLNGYDIISTEAKFLIEFIGIANPDAKLELTEEQRKTYERGKLIEDIPIEVLKCLAVEYHSKSLSGKDKIYTNPSEQFNNETAIDKTIDKIKDKFKLPRVEVDNSKKLNENNDEKDEDDFIKSTVDFEKKKERLTEKIEEEIEQLTKIQELTEAALTEEKYSYLWFKSLLELEYLSSFESNSNGNEISIQFSKVEKENGTDRTLILKNPNRYIPQNIEDIGDLTVRLYYGNETSSVSVEVVNVKEYTLRAKLNKSADISEIDINTIHKAVIDIKNPIFILDELRKNFIRLPFEDSFNLQTNLTENIKFIFGPPGTGKTTHLAKNVLIPLMQETEDLKILVLTPTNKAADVLINKIIESMGENEDYFNWLVRFGTTGDSTIEQSSIFCEKNFDIRKRPKNVTVTTIARFPYDYFQPTQSQRLHLRELEWDYIVIDEASMIPLINIVFPLYYKIEAKFIIAGDPFQIQPITSVSEWKDENIYTLVGLNNFKNPKTIPHDYKVVNLPTQYRSIPSIGNLFSNFTYDGILKNNRSENSQRPLKLNGLKIKDINIIKFPVSPFSSIYKAQKINHSSNYQIYSAIFTYEFTKYITRQINQNQNEFFRIGIVCPYKAQSTLVQKLISSSPFETTNVDIQVGTIHGFQGDECDIIISLFNSPPYISDKPDMFLNKQNILNVSISRARDYLFILMPDDSTKNISKLKKIKQIEDLIHIHAKENSTEFHSSQIEEVIFKNKNFIEQNSFTTTHQSVNVYSEAEMLYEIRCEETAIDIQISTGKVIQTI